LNAEGAKVSQSAQKKREKNKTKNEGEKEDKKRDFLNLENGGINCEFNFGFHFVFLFCISFLRSLRNLRALCVQKIPVFLPP
jgi:hypothetical protein